MPACDCPGFVNMTTHRYRSHTCAQLTKSDAGQTVRLSGWVHRVRDHGGLLFIDLRDHYGMTQIVADPDSPAFKTAEAVRGEWVIRVDGEVKARTAETANTNLPTGEIEIFAREIEVLSAAKELPLKPCADRKPARCRVATSGLPRRGDGGSRARSARHVQPGKSPPHG